MHRSRGGLRSLIVASLFATGCVPSCLSHLVPDAGLGGPDFTGPAADLSSLLDGGEFDFDHDGVPEAITTFDGGARITRFQRGAGNTVLTIVFPDEATVHVEGDLDQDGTLDYQFDSTFDAGVLNELEQTDPHHTGTLTDTVRSTITFFDDAGAQLTQVMSLGDGGTTTYTGPATAGDDKCEGSVPFPSLGGRTETAPRHEKIEVIDNGEPGACDPHYAPQIAAIIDEAIAADLDCLQTTNLLLFAELSIKLAQMDHYYIGCGNPCSAGGADALATTGINGLWNWISRRKGSMQTNLTPTIYSHSNEEIREVFTHELLHLAGNEHYPMRDGNGGHDFVYGCGRYCNVCASNITEGNSGATEDFAADYARCLPPDQRGLAGVNAIHPLVDTCSAANQCEDCTKCNDVYAYYCDGELAGSTACCATGGPHCQQNGGLCVPLPENPCAKWPVGWCKSGPAH